MRKKTMSYGEEKCLNCRLNIYQKFVLVGALALRAWAPISDTTRIYVLSEEKNKWDKLNLSRPNVPGQITQRISIY